MLPAGHVPDGSSVHVPRICLHGLQLWQDALVESIRQPSTCLALLTAGEAIKGSATHSGGRPQSAWSKLAFRRQNVSCPNIGMLICRQVMRL